MLTVYFCLRCQADCLFVDLGFPARQRSVVKQVLNCLVSALHTNSLLALHLFHHEEVAFGAGGFISWNPN